MGTTRFETRKWWLIAVGAAAIALSTQAAAYACTPQNGTTVLDSPTTAQGSAGTVIKAHTTGVTGTSTWKLYLNKSVDWCMTQNTQLGSSWTGTGNVPANTVQGAIPTGMTKQSYDLCFNNGGGGGNTAAPVVFTII